MNVLMNILGYSLTYIEFFGVLTYLISVILAIKVNKLTWHTGILSSVLFFILYFNSHLYANAFLQVILIFVCVKGILRWKKENNKKVTTLNWTHRLYVFLISSICVICFGSIINLFPILTDPYPYLDMSILILTIVGQLLMTYKKLESWIIWIIVNILTLILCIFLGYYLIVIQCIVLIIMDIFGLKEWNKNLRYD